MTATGRESEDLTAALASLLPAEWVAEFPAWETLPHERLSPRSDTVGRRLAVLRRLAHPDPSDPATGQVRVVVAPVRSVLQPLVPGLADLEPVALRAGEEMPLEEAVERLAAAAYSRVDLVEKRGEFAVRGGILDVFPPTEEHPLRVELWGDTVEEVRWFKVADQRSLEVAPHGLWAPPCRELLLTPDVQARAKALLVTHPQLADVLGRLAEGIAVEGMESLAPVLVEELELLVDHLPEGTHVLVCDPERVRARAADLVATSAEFLAASWAAAAGGGSAPLDLGAASFRTLAEVRAHALERGVPWWALTPFGADEELAAPDGEDVDDRAVATTGFRAAEAYRGDTARAVGDARRMLADGWRVVLVTEGHGPAERLVERLREAEVAARLDLDLARGSGGWHRPRRHRPPRARFRPRPSAVGGAHRERPRRAAQLDQGHAAHAVASPTAGGPAAAAGGRPRGARAARRRALRRDGPAHRAGCHPRVPRHRVRPRQARPAR